MGNLLEDFVSTAVTRVGHDLHPRLDFGNTSNNAANGDELAHVGAMYLTDCERLDVVRRKGLEIQIATNSLDQKDRKPEKHLLASHKFGREGSCFRVLRLALSLLFASLVKDDIQGVFLHGYIDGGAGHYTIDDFTKQLGISTRIFSNAIDKAGDAFVVLGCSTSLGSMDAPAMLDRNNSPLKHLPDRFREIAVACWLFVAEAREGAVRIAIRTRT